MSQEDVEMVRRVYEASARRDTEAVLALYDTDVEWDSSRSPLGRLMGEQGICRGHEGLRKWFREYYEAWDIVNDYKDLIDAGEHVVSVATGRARGRASGAEVELAEYAAVWTVRDGKIVRVVWFPSLEEALEAAGLSE